MKPEPPKAPPYVLAFIEAVCPHAPALYAASFTEKTCLTDATDLIVSLRAKVEEMKIKIEMQQGLFNAAMDRCEKAEARVMELEPELQRRANQLGVACLKHDLTHSLACGHCLEQAREALRLVKGMHVAFKPHIDKAINDALAQKD
jgi:nitrite reductase/ring-hydroxylating ferredoxin subunit